MPFPLRDLMRVLEVAESGSISEAARKLHIAQPALSKTIHSVEEYLGIRLFEREHSGVQPTPAAVDILARARAVRGELHRIEKDVEAHRTRARHRIVIGVVPIHPLDQFSRGVAGLMTTYPSVDVGVEVGPLDTLLEWLSAGKVDFLFTPLTLVPLGAGFIEQSVYWEDLVVACGHRSPLFGRETLSVDSICNQPWAAGPVGSESHARLSELCRAFSRPLPRIALEIDMVPARRSAVQHSTLLSIFQRIQVTPPGVRAELRALPFTWPHTVRAIGTIRSSAGPHELHDAFVLSFRQVLAMDVV